MIWIPTQREWITGFIRSSTRLADYHEGEVSEWYEDKIITWDEVLKYLGT